MPTLFQNVQGFAGASGVGIVCLVGLFLIVSVFADNLPKVATLLLGSSSWGALATLPLLVVGYVVGLLAIALVDRGTPLTPAGIKVIGSGVVAARYGQLVQEAETLSGSVIAFVLLGAAALLNTMVFPGWTRTLGFTGALCGGIAVSAWKMSRIKHAAAAALTTVAGADADLAEVSPVSDA